MGIAYDDLLSPPALGVDDVQKAIDVLKVLASLPPIDNIRYVSPLSGSDVTGTGSIGRPYASVGVAMAAITDATRNKRYAILVTGRCAPEVVPVVMKANVFIAGLGINISRVQAPSWEVDEDWAGGLGDQRGGFANITVAGDVNFNMATVSSNEGKLYAFGVWFNNNVTFTAFSIINQFFGENLRLFSVLTMNGGALTWGSSILQAAAVFNEGPEGTQFQCSTNDVLFTDLTFNHVAAVNVVLLQGGRCDTLTVNGALEIFCTDENNIPGAVLTGGASIAPLSPGVCFTGAGTTAARPPIARYPVGYNYFDTDLGKPIWNNGGAWVDATGTVV